MPKYTIVCLHSFVKIRDYSQYDDITLYQQYQYELSQSPESVKYSVYIYKDTPIIESSCENWVDFAIRGPNLPFDNVKVSSISLSTSNEDLIKRVITKKNATCTNTNMVSYMMANIQSRKQFYISCDGHMWRQFSCNGLNILCFDCLKDCSYCPGKSFGLRPCVSRSCNTDTASYSILSYGLKEEKMFPEFLSPIILSDITMFSAIVSLNVSKPGIFYCLPYRGPIGLISVSLIQSQGTYRYLQSGTVTNMTLTNLNPDTTYTLYCYTQSFEGDRMDFNDILAGSVSFTTQCCRFLKFTPASFSVPVYTSTAIQPTLFSFSISSLPTQNCKVGLSASGVNANLLSFVPSAVFTYFPENYPLVQFFQIISQSPGYFNVTIAPKSGCKNAIFPDMVNFVVRKPTSPPPAPVLTSAIFSNDGTNIVLSFDSLTDKAGYATQFDCSNLLSFGFASNFKCFWDSPKVLFISMISVPSTYELNLKDSITLLSGVLQAQCDSSASPSCTLYPKNIMTTVLVTAPMSPIVPIIMLSMPSQIGPCDSLLLNAISSYGSGGRVWYSVSWSVTVNDITNDVVQNYLNTNGTSLSSPIYVPQMLLAPNTYSITLSITNFLGVTSSLSKKVTVSSNANIPQVSILGPSLVNILSWQSLNLVADASVIQCGNVIDGDLSYLWSVYQGIGIISGIVSESLNPSTFMLSPFSLKPNTTYTVQVIVFIDKNSKKSNSASVIVQVGISGVVAVISGGSTWTASAMSKIVLDASLSYDIDFPNRNNLTYSWSCIEYMPSYGSPCFSVKNYITGSHPIVTIPANVVTQNSVSFNFSCTIENPFGFSASASSIVNVMRQSLALGAISTTDLLFNSNEQIEIDAIIKVPENAQASAIWDTGDLSYSTFSAAVLGVIVSNFTAGTSRFSLILASNVLSPNGKYTFSLRVNTLGPSSALASSSVTLTINSPPAGGLMYVSPSTGTALNTVFSIWTSSWVDNINDYPISYVIGYLTGSTGDLTIVKPLNSGSSVSTVLSQGLASSQYKLTCIVYASDIHGDTASTTQVVVVNPISQSSLANVVGSSISLALITYDIGQVMTIITAATVSVNSVSCSTVTTCGNSYNRYPCSYTTNTCGPCLPGYTGADGDSNTLCILTATASSLRLLSSSNADNSRRTSRSFSLISYFIPSKLSSIITPQAWQYTDGSVCRNNGQCFSGKCRSGRCSASTKTCPNDCSNNGVCTFFDRFNRQIPSCTPQDFYCWTICICNQGFSGQDCSLGKNQLVSRQQLRGKLCLNLWITSLIENLSSDVIVQRALSVSNIISDPTQMTLEGFLNCSYLLASSVEKGYSYLSTTSDVQSLLNAFSLILKGDEYGYLPDGFLLKIVDIIDHLGSLIQSFQALNGDSNLFQTDNFLISTQKSYLFQLAEHAVETPRTPLESLYKLESTYSQLQLTESMRSSFSVVAINSLVYSRNILKIPIDDESLSLPIGFYYTFDSTLSMQNQFTSLLTVYNHVQMNYSTGQEKLSSGSFFCYLAPVAYNFSVYCPKNSKATLFTCPGSYSGHVTYNCSTYSRVPTCVSLTAFNISSNIKCSLSSFSTSETTCSCTAPAVSSSHVFYKVYTRVEAVRTPFTLLFTPNPQYQKQGSSITAYVGSFSILIIFLMIFMYTFKSERQRSLESRKDRKHKMKMNMFDNYDALISKAFPEELFCAYFYRRFLYYFIINNPIFGLGFGPDQPDYSNTLRVLIAIGHVVTVASLSIIVISVTSLNNGIDNILTIF